MPWEPASSRDGQRLRAPGPVLGARSDFLFLRIHCTWGMVARTTLTGQLRGQFPSLTRWMLGIRLRLSGLVAGLHFQRVISPALRLCLLSLLTLGNFIFDLYISDHIRLPLFSLFLDLPSVPSRCSPNFLIFNRPDSSLCCPWTGGPSHQ